MTNIDIYYNGDEVARLKAVGHTEYAPEGEDIVCAGVSTLLQTAVLAVQKMYGINIMKIMDNGFIELIIPNESEVQIIVKAIIYGLKDIESGYPKNIKIKEIK